MTTEKQYLAMLREQQRVRTEAWESLKEEERRILLENSPRLRPFYLALEAAKVENPPHVAIIERLGGEGPGFEAFIPGQRDHYGLKAWLRIAKLRDCPIDEWQWTLRLDKYKGCKADYTEIQIGNSARKADLTPQYPHVRQQAIGIIAADGWTILESCANEEGE